MRIQYIQYIQYILCTSSSFPLLFLHWSFRSQIPPRSLDLNTQPSACIKSNGTACAKHWLPEKPGANQPNSKLVQNVHLPSVIWTHSVFAQISMCKTKNPSYIMKVAAWLHKRPQATANALWSLWHSERKRAKHVIWINLALTWVKFLLKKSSKRNIAPYASFPHQIQLFSIASATAQGWESTVQKPRGERQSHIHTPSCRLGPRRFVPVLVCVTHTSWKWILQDHNVRNPNIEPSNQLWSFRWADFGSGAGMAYNIMHLYHEVCT